MKCQFCNCQNSKVLDSRASLENNSVRRRRECLGCGKRFTTYETIESTPILVIKKDGSRQPFDIMKIKKGIIKACEKRPVSLNQIDEICSSIEKEFQNAMAQEITSDEIGEKVMDKLKILDEVSYVRFASVYRQFKDITNFIKFLDEL
ncbi:MAG: transcriptional regulator NrdR [Clostridia bacterium]|nr:transcriptional regulator NrdR [Clostridia bacterium]